MIVFRLKKYNQVGGEMRTLSSKVRRHIVFSHSSYSSLLSSSLPPIIIAVILVLKNKSFPFVPFSIKKAQNKSKNENCEILNEEINKMIIHIKHLFLLLLLILFNLAFFYFYISLYYFLKRDLCL